MHSEQSAYADLLYAESERKAGYQGRSAEEVLKDMDRLIEKARG